MAGGISSKQRLYQINELSAKGRGLAQGRVEIPGTLPGEEVLADPSGRSKALLKQVISPSADRTALRCSHFPTCGGCALQHMEYTAQLELKQGWVAALFDEEVRPIIGCQDPFRYRNKMEFSFSQNRSGDRFLGLMLAGSRGRVLDLTECHLASTWFTETLHCVKAFWGQSRLRAYHHATDEGHLRTLTLREAIAGKGKMAMLTVSGNPTFALSRAELSRFVEALKRVYPGEDLSIFLQIQQVAKGRQTQFFEMLLSGPDHITETLEIAVQGRRRKLTFKVSPTSFFQPNTRQAEILYSEALSMIGDLQGAQLLDLYCGGGALGLSAAPFAREVVGMEINPHSAFDAGWNREVNRVENFRVICGDVAEILENFEGSCDVVMVDPPRIGLGQRAIRHLCRFRPREILYISCHPKTQANDAGQLKGAGYRIRAIQPVDQFPHTAHIENIVHLVYL